MDAAIAATATQGVVAPETCGIGGDLFALVHLGGWEQPGTQCFGAAPGPMPTQASSRPRRHPPKPPTFCHCPRSVSTVGQRSPPSWADCR